MADDNMIWINILTELFFERHHWQSYSWHL